MSSIEATCDPVMASSVNGYKTQWDNNVVDLFCELYGDFCIVI